MPWPCWPRSNRAAGSVAAHPSGIHYVLIFIYYVLMSSLLQIRNVPESVRRALKARAAARGESLNGYLLDLISREVERPTVGEVLDRAARRAEHAGASAVDALDAARAERDRQLYPRPPA